jgi:hypothetical protein
MEHGKAGPMEIRCHHVLKLWDAMAGSTATPAMTPALFMQRYSIWGLTFGVVKG